MSELPEKLMIENISKNMSDVDEYPAMVRDTSLLGEY